MRKNNLIVVLLIVVALLAAWNIYSYVTRPKMGYVVIKDVYNSFLLKQELEKKLNTVKTARKAQFDSLTFELKVMANKLKNQEKISDENMALFDAKRQELTAKQHQMEQDNMQLTAKYDEQILTQLTQYVKDYGKEHGYTYLFGTDGNGSLMYANDANDVTKEVIESVNNRYKGNNQ